MVNKYTFLILIPLFISSCSNMSEGTRTGKIISFTKKGFFNKSYEGILLSGSSNDDDTHSFRFSLDGFSKRGESIPTLIDTINKSMQLDIPVRIHYNEELLTDPLFMRGDSRYFVDKIEIIYSK